MGFNWQGAIGSALQQGGILATGEAARLEKLEEREYQERVAARKEKAELTKELALKKFGYEINTALNEQKSGLKLKEQEHKSGLDAERDEAKAAREAKDFDREQGVLNKNRKGILDYEYEKKSALEEKKASLQGESAAKAEYTPGKALKEIATVDKAIANINASGGISDALLDSLPDHFKAFVAMSGGGGKELQEEDKAQLLESLNKYRDYLQQFAPENGTPILGVGSSKASTGNQNDIASFIKKNKG